MRSSEFSPEMSRTDRDLYKAIKGDTPRILTPIEQRFIDLPMVVQVYITLGDAVAKRPDIPQGAKDSISDTRLHVLEMFTPMDKLIMGEYIEFRNKQNIKKGE